MQATINQQKRKISRQRDILSSLKARYLETDRKYMEVRGGMPACVSPTSTQAAVCVREYVHQWAACVHAWVRACSAHLSMYRREERAEGTQGQQLQQQQQQGVERL